MTIASIPTAQPQREGTVVIVDDDPAITRALMRVLGTSHYELFACNSPHQAIERVTQGNVVVVVSDITMPEMSGVELLRTIREHDSDLPVVLMTGLPDVASASEAIEYGAFMYLLKPIDSEKLKRVVDRAARLYRLTQAKREALNSLGNDAQASDRAGLEANFERALKAIWVAFQPIVEVSSRVVFGYEALLRCDEPTMRGPGPVLDAAEKLGALDRLGRMIRERAANSLSEGDKSHTLFVNLHPQDLLDPELLKRGTALDAIAKRVVLEVTERAAISDTEKVRSTIAQLREIGFRIAIDDLGAGYAGLSSFALLEPEFVKIDMSLVRDIDSTPVKQRVVSSVTALCKDMGMLIVGEGVETAAERDMLVELGCDLLQGYLLARPGRPFPTTTW